MERENMAQRESVQEWARTAAVSHPPDWGQLEADMVARTPKPSGGAFQRVVLGVLMPVVVLLYGLPWIALGWLLLFLTSGAEGWWVLATFTFIPSFALPAGSLLTWLETRHRGAGNLFVTASTSAAAITALLVLRSVIDLSETGWFAWMLLALAVGSLAVFIAILVASKTTTHRSLPRTVRLRTMLSPSNEVHYLQARNDGLQALLDYSRITLDDEERERVRSTPLGHWRKLDSPAHT